jgi:hypothetical protein
MQEIIHFHNIIIYLLAFLLGLVCIIMFLILTNTKYKILVQYVPIDSTKLFFFLEII